MNAAALHKSRTKAALIWAAPYLVIAAVLLAWELTVRLNGIAPIFLPAPSSILKYLVAMTIDGSMPYHLSITLIRIIVGFGVAAVTGVLAGIAMGMSPLTARIFDTWIGAFYPLPKISLIPLLIIWLGIGSLRSSSAR
jgi:NitT/TauT family transport system permease protein